MNRKTSGSERFFSSKLCMCATWKRMVGVYSGTWPQTRMWLKKSTAHRPPKRISCPSFWCRKIHANKALPNIKIVNTSTYHLEAFLVTLTIHTLQKERAWKNLFKKSKACTPSYVELVSQNKGPHYRRLFIVSVTTRKRNGNKWGCTKKDRERERKRERERERERVSA